MADFNKVATEFVQYYYQVFDSDRAQLQPLYRDSSMLTFENAPTPGAAGIVEKLSSLPFQKIQHRVDTLDAQPSNTDGGVLVLVTGALLVDEEQKVMSFTQTFQLLQEGGSYYVFNDIFRLIYPAA